MNERLHEYLGDRLRGLTVWHDHFVGVDGDAVVLDVRMPSPASGGKGGQHDRTCT